MSENYFARKSSKDCVAVVMSKAQNFYDFQTTNGWLQKLKNSYRFYYGSFYDSIPYAHNISYGGAQGEYTQMGVNHFRNIAQHLLVMTTSSRPAMQARAVNTDYKSQVQATLANNILDYYMREKNVETYIKNAVESAIVLGAGFVKLEWDSNAGEIYDYEIDEETDEPNPEKPIYDGDVKFTNLTPFDVVFDSFKEDQNHDWVITRCFKNKYDLSAKYPELKNEIEALDTKSDYILNNFSTDLRVDETDEVPVYEFYHKKTESLPLGRYILYLSQDIILYDGPMPYRFLPVLRVSPSDLMGTTHGYTPMFDLMPLQEAINSLYSTILSNQSAFGVQNIVIPRGEGITVNHLEGGLNIIECDMKNGIPTPLNLTSTPKEVFEFLAKLVQDMETLSGVNSVARGNPEASLRSGSALALVQSLALQFASNLQSQYVKLIEQLGSNLIKMLQDFATAKRAVTLISGITNKTEVKEFSSDDLSNISRVIVDVSNPLSRTTSGKLQLAESLLQYQLIKDPQQYLTLVNTGNLDSATEEVASQINLIRLENEKLLSGKLPRALALDDHVKHINSHNSVLYDPDLRDDPVLTQNVLDHIMEHYSLLNTTDPTILQMLGYQVPPPPQQLPTEQGGEQQGNVPQNAEMTQSPTGELPQSIQGPGLENPVGLPNIPKVNPELLPNPAIEPKAMQ